jgi:autotransporter-associated beta strand protein
MNSIPRFTLLRTLPFLAAVLLPVSLVRAADGSWNINAGGSWSNAGNWTGSTIADGAGATGNFLFDITGARTVTIDGAVASRTLGILNIGDANGSAAYTVAADGGGTLTMNNGASAAQINQISTSFGDTISAPLILGSALTIANASTKNLTISGSISTSTGTTQTITNSGSGSGQVQLNGGVGSGVTGVTQNSTNSAGLFIQNSALQVNSGGTTLTYVAGTRLTVNGGVSGTGDLILKNNSSTNAGSSTGITFAAVPGTINNTGAIVNSGSGTGSQSVAGGLIGTNVTGITQNSATSALTIGTSAISLGSGGLILTDSAGSLTVAGGVGGTGNLTLNNDTATNGALSLTSNIVNNAGTITNSGTGTGSTLISGSSTAGSGSIGSNVTEVIQNSSTSALSITMNAIRVNSTVGTTLTDTLGSLTVSGGTAGTGNLILKNNSSTTGGITLSTLSGSSINHTGTVTNSGSGSGSTVISAVIGANVTGVIQNGVSSLTLTGANTYTGGTTVSKGTLIVGTNGRLGANTGTVDVSSTGASNGASVLNLATAADTVIGALSGTVSGSGNSATINNGGTGRNFTVNEVDTSTTYGGVIAGAGAFTLGSLSTGTLALSGDNTYTGATTINAGTLQLGDGGTTGSLSTSSGISGSGTFAIKRSNAVSQGTDFSGSAITGGLAVAQSGSGTATLTAANTYSGGTTVNSGTLILGNASGSATGSGSLSVRGGATLAGTGRSAGSGINIVGTSTSDRATVLVGHTAETPTNTSASMTVLAPSAMLGNADLVFNLNTAVAGEGNQLNIGATTINFSAGMASTVLTLNLQGSGIIAANTSYALITGTAVGSSAATSQFSGLSFGASTGDIATGLITRILSSGDGGTGNLTLDLTGLGEAAYGQDSYLFLYQNSTTGVSAIEVAMVPEPTTWAMIIAGLCVVILFRRRRNHN